MPRRNSRPSRPVALTIAGSDSGGGAGLQADLKTFESLGVHGTSAITCVTAQNPREVSGVQSCKPEIVRRQIEAVFSGFRPTAVKTGMLFTKETVRVVARVLRDKKSLMLIVDPVMVATSGARLLQASAVTALQEELLPLASLVTPNVPEAEVLSGQRIRDPEDLRSAARSIHDRVGCPVLVKGGHLSSLNEAIDLFYDGTAELLLRGPFVKGVSTHGTGCTYSAAIAAYAALGRPLSQAVSLAKEYITQAIARSFRVTGHDVLNHLWMGIRPRKRTVMC